jgi:hypothetical protein
VESKQHRKNFSDPLLTLSFAFVDWHQEASAAETQFVLTVAEIAKLPRVSVRAKDEKGKDAVWEGTTLHEVLRAAGVNFGEAIRGAALANYLLVEAADGYRVVFTLPEVDPAFTDLTFLLADRRDGQPMDENEGKLRIVVPHEKKTCEMGAPGGCLIDPSPLARFARSTQWLLSQLICDISCCFRMTARGAILALNYCLSSPEPASQIRAGFSRRMRGPFPGEARGSKFEPDQVNVFERCAILVG